MNDRFYNADVVDAILKSAADTSESLIELVAQQEGTVSRLEQELAIAKAAASNKVELDKVASTKGASPELANELAQLLADRAMISDDAVEKFASACTKDPNAMAKIAIRALRLSETPSEQGRGIKAASVVSADPVEAEKELEKQLWLDYCKSSQYRR